MCTIESEDKPCPNSSLPSNPSTLQGLLTNDQALRQVIEDLVYQVLQAEVTDQVQADKYEHTAQRRGYRNGTRTRDLTTRVGTLHLVLPQVRGEAFTTDLFGRWQRCEQALVLVMMKMVVTGVSTRKVMQITEDLCGKTFSTSTVSALCQQLDPAVQAWNDATGEWQHRE